MVETLKKIFIISPAHTGNDVGNCQLRMMMEGKYGVVQFVLETGWYPRNYKNDFAVNPIASDVGYHSYVPIYKGQVKRESCPFLHGSPCYYDGSGLLAEAMYEVLLHKGSDGVWEELEKYYYDIFDGVK